MPAAQLPYEMWREILKLASGNDPPLHANLLNPMESVRRWRKDDKGAWNIDEIEEDRRKRHSLRMRRRKVRVVCSNR